MSDAPLRIGGVKYLNAAPLCDALDAQRFDIRRDHPSVVARMLREGEVDVALVPVAALLADGAPFRVVPGVCIGAEGPVDSVLLVGRTPPERWERLLLDGVSRSSAALTRVLLAGPLGERLESVELIDAPPGQALELAGPADGALVIGDAARQLPDELEQRIDLAEVWHQWTGLPAVFAVWAGRPDLPREAIAALREAARKGLAELCARYEGEDLAYLSERLRYRLDDRALMGLRRFAALGLRAGIFRTADVQLYGPSPRRRTRPEQLDDVLLRASRGEALEAAEEELLSSASLADLAAAARLRQGALPPIEVATEPLAEAIDLPAAVPLLASLRALRAADPAAVRVQPDADGVGFLRRVALLRLLFPSARIAVPWREGTEDAAVSALQVGADVLQVQLPDEAVARADRLGAVYRAVRDAGSTALGLPELSQRALSRRGVAAT